MEKNKCCCKNKSKPWSKKKKIEKRPFFLLELISSPPPPSSSNTATVASSLLPSPLVFLLSTVCMWKAEALPLLATCSVRVQAASRQQKELAWFSYVFLFYALFRLAIRDKIYTKIFLRACIRNKHVYTQSADVFQNKVV
jgi:hypothetical protein